MNEVATKTRNLPQQGEPSKQYDLFTSFFGDPKDLSNTIELWDAIPKYAVSARQQNARRDEGGRLPVYKQPFQYKSPALDVPVECMVKIQPVLIEDESGQARDYYPSQNEELIEEVLKKIFTDQKYGFHNPPQEESWVRFTLHMIRKELKARGHTRSLQEIKNSLTILSKCVIEVEMKGRGRGLAYNNAILADMTRQTREDLEENPSAKWVARLPSLVSKSINELSYRQFNYGLHMRLANPLSRWLHKRLVHRYRNANVMTPHLFALSDIERDSGLLNNSRMSANIKALETVLDELKGEFVLMRWEGSKVYEGRKIIDVNYRVFATSEFTSEVKAAHKRQSDNQAKLTQRR